MINSKLNNNVEVRAAIQDKKLRYWQVADALGISENTLCRRLRKELPEDEKKKILEVISRM